MNQAPASEVLEWLREPSGECDTAKLFEVLNQARNRFYLMYDSVPLFEIVQCFEVQRFCVSCDHCHDTYSGITLPRDFQTVEAMWLNSQPVQLFSSWREWQRGFSSECSCGLSKVDMPGLFSTERDLTPGTASRLQVVASSPADKGKKVFLRGIDAENLPFTEELVLEDRPVTSTHSVRGLVGGSGFSKVRTIGTVSLSTEEGRLLSLYGPDETMPGYKRIKISGLGNSGYPASCVSHVNIRGARRYFPIFRDTDPVETDNRMAFEEMARFLRINAKQSKDRNDLQAATYHLTLAKQALLGDKSRELGKSTRSDLKFTAPRIGPRRLGSYGRR